MINLDTLPQKVNARFALAGVLLAGCVVGATPASAQGLCLSRDQTISNLENRHGESLRMTGIATTGRLVEFWANEETGTWTLFYSDPGGTTSCLIAAGEGFEVYEPPPKGQEG